MLLLNGDCIEQMQKLIDDGVQVDSVVTDPPYHLASIVKRFGKEGSAPAQYGTDGAFKRAATGFMGKEWDGGDIAFRPETWELALKLLKPGGHILAFSASRNYHRMAVAIEDAGFEIRDQMMWLYGSGFPKSLNIGDGWGTALKPAHEPIVMARKFIEGTNKQNKEKYGTGGLNIDGCRIEGEGNTERKITNRKTRSEDGVWTDGNSGMKAEGSQYADADPRGRFPANVMHNGLEEEWAKFFYCPKTSKAEKNKGLDSFEAKPMAWGNQAKAELKRGNLDWKGNQGDGTKHNKVSMRVNTHPTVKPQELMKYLCRMVTPKGGTVLDPFMGSGSTGCAAKDEGFNFIGIEKEKEYFDIADARIKVTSPLSEFME
jgi:site-specific DNA-methyltransferase (adenine-specific)